MLILCTRGASLLCECVFTEISLRPEGGHSFRHELRSLIASPHERKLRHRKRCLCCDLSLRGTKSCFLCERKSLTLCTGWVFLCASACCLCARLPFYPSSRVWPESRWCKQYKHATHPRLAPQGGGGARQHSSARSRCVGETPCVGDSRLFASSASLPRSRIPATCHRGGGGWGGGTDAAEDKPAETTETRRDCGRCVIVVHNDAMVRTVWWECQTGQPSSASDHFPPSPALLYLPQSSSWEAVSSWGVKLSNRCLPQITDRTAFLMLACFSSCVTTILGLTFSFLHIFTINRGV